MARYRRVAFADRCQIRAYLASEIRVSVIAKELGFHRSTVHRELVRNRIQKGYRPVEAQKLAEQRKQSCRRKPILVGALERAVVAKIEQKWSPEQISGRFRRERVARVSHETIYRYLRPRRELWIHLRRFNKRGPGRQAARKAFLRQDWMLSIRSRPAVINSRRRIGDWERDTMLGLDRKMVIVCTERKSRYTKLEIAKEPASVHLTGQTDALLKATWRPIYSITNDNGSEFKDALFFDVPVYYCDPRSPHQRGTVENSIGLLRQYIPKRADLKTYTPEEIHRIENAMNSRPRKILDYRTPHEVFFNQSVALAV